MRQAANNRHRGAADFAFDQVGRRSDLVGDGHRGDLHRAAVGVLLTAIIHEHPQSGCPEREIRLAAAPGASSGIRQNNAQVRGLAKGQSQVFGEA